MLMSEDSPTLIRIEAELRSIKELLSERMSVLERDLTREVSAATLAHENLKKDIHTAHSKIRVLESRWDKIYGVIFGAAITGGGIGAAGATFLRGLFGG